MSRRRAKKEDWGGEDDSDGEVTGPQGQVGMDSILSRGSSKRTLELTKRREEDDEPGSSGDENEFAEDSDTEQGDESKNTREKSRIGNGTDGLQRRDHEVIHTTRLKQQGIQLDEEAEEEEEKVGREWSGMRQTKEQMEARKAKAKANAEAAAAAATAEATAGEDADMVDAFDGEEEDDQRARQARIKAVFDKNKEDKYMTFDAEDPLRPNPNKRRAAAREDDELEDDTKDPWLLQAADDAARAVASGEDPNIRQRITKSSTDIFAHDDDAPVFDQSAARIILLKHMQPGETVLRAVKRLGAPAGGASSNGAPAPSKPITKQKNVRTKPSIGGGSNSSSTSTHAEDPAVARARKVAFDELTEAAQGFIASGQPEIYQDGYEKIARYVKIEEERVRAAAAHRAAAAAAQATTSQPSASQDARARAAARLQRKRDARAAGLPEPESSDDDDDDIPMSTRPSSSSAAAAVVTPAGASATAAAAASSDSLWVYHWSGETELNGPYPSSKMVDWKRAGLITNDVLVQRVTPTTAASAKAGTGTWFKLAQVDFQTGEISTLAPASSSSTIHAQEPPKKKFKF